MIIPAADNVNCTCFRMALPTALSTAARSEAMAPLRLFYDDVSPAY